MRDATLDSLKLSLFGASFAWWALRSLADIGVNLRGQNIAEYKLARGTR